MIPLMDPWFGAKLSPILPKWVNWPEIYRTIPSHVSRPSPVHPHGGKQWWIAVPGWRCDAGWARPDGAENSDSIAAGYDQCLTIARMKAHYHLLLIGLQKAWRGRRDQRRGWSAKTHQHLPGYWDTPFDSLDWWDHFPAADFFRYVIPHALKHLLRRLH